jgi:hypothetical protein
MVLDFLWKLLYRSRKIHLRVYRAIDQREGIVSRSIVYENIQTKRFVRNSCFLDQIACAESDVMDLSDAWNVIDLSDAWNALNGLREVPLLMDNDRWHRLGAESIDEAVRKGDALVGQRHAVGNNLAALWDGEGQKEYRRTRVHLTIGAGSIESVRLKEQVRRLSRRVWKKGRRKSVHWVALEPTAAGCQCQVLVIDGSEQHQVP